MVIRVGAEVGNRSCSWQCLLKLFAALGGGDDVSKGQQIRLVAAFEVFQSSVSNRREHQAPLAGQ